MTFQELAELAIEPKTRDDIEQMIADELKETN